ncbi:hypothetical protein ACOSQ2_014192 [Xanthoceras sorbifolium]
MMENIEKVLDRGEKIELPVDKTENLRSQDLSMDVVMLSLRTARGLDLKSFREAFGCSLAYSLCKAYKPFIESGHVL